jgi:hypothetical protein
MAYINKIIHLGNMICCWLLGVVGKKTPQNSNENFFLSYKDGFNGLEIM